MIVCLTLISYNCGNVFCVCQSVLGPNCSVLAFLPFQSLLIVLGRCLALLDLFAVSA